MPKTKTPTKNNLIFYDLAQVTKYFTSWNYSENDLLHLASIGGFGIYFLKESIKDGNNQEIVQISNIQNISDFYKYFVIGKLKTCNIEGQKVTKQQLRFKADEVLNFEQKLIAHKIELDNLEHITSIVCAWIGYAINNDEFCENEIENLNKGAISLQTLLCTIVTFSFFGKRLEFYRNSANLIHQLETKQITEHEYKSHEQSIKLHLKKLEKEETDNYLFLIQKAKADILNHNLIPRLFPSFVTMTEMPNVIKWCKRELPILYSSLDGIDPEKNMVVYLDDAEQWIKSNRLNFPLNTLSSEEFKWINKCCSDFCENTVKLSTRKNILYGTLLKFIAYFIQKISDKNEENLEVEQSDNIPYLSLAKASKFLNCYSSEDIIQCAINNDLIRIFVKIDGKRSKLFITIGEQSIYGITQTLISNMGKNKEIIDAFKKLPIFELEERKELYNLFIKGEITFEYLFNLKSTKEAVMYGINVGAIPLGLKGGINLEDIFIHREDIREIKKCLDKENAAKIIISKDVNTISKNQKSNTDFSPATTFKDKWTKRAKELKDNNRRLKKYQIAEMIHEEEIKKDQSFPHKITTILRNFKIT